MLGPAAHGFERVPGPGCREEYVVRTFPGVVRDGFLSPGQGFVELPVQDELIQTVKKDPVAVRGIGPGFLDKTGNLSGKGFHFFGPGGIDRFRFGKAGQKGLIVREIDAGAEVALCCGQREVKFRKQRFQVQASFRAFFSKDERSLPGCQELAGLFTAQPCAAEYIVFHICKKAGMDGADVTELVFSECRHDFTESVPAQEKTVSFRIEPETAAFFVFFDGSAQSLSQRTGQGTVIGCRIAVDIDFPFLAACVAAGSGLAAEFVEIFGNDGNHGSTSSLYAGFTDPLYYLDGICGRGPVKIPDRCPFRQKVRPACSLYKEVKKNRAKAGKMA